MTHVKMTIAAIAIAFAVPTTANAQFFGGGFDNNPLMAVQLAARLQALVRAQVLAPFSFHPDVVDAEPPLAQRLVGPARSL